MLPETILVTNKTNILYLSGFSGSGYLVLHGKGGFLFTDGRYRILAENEVNGGAREGGLDQILPRGFKIIDTTAGFDDEWRNFLKKTHIRKIGIEGNVVTLRFFKQLKKLSRKVKLIDVKNELDKKRMVKKSHELNDIKRAQKITEKVFETLKKELKKGMTEKEIAWQIEVLAHEFGAEKMAFHPIVAINENSACPHHKNGNKRLNKGDILLIDMGVKYRGYCSDMTRMIFAGQPTEEQRKIYELVLGAQENAIKNLRAGISGKKADNFARNVIKKAGFEKQFSHSLGHGVGLDIHELPNLSQKYKEKIPGGSVVTIEPGVYLPGKFGVRIEDMVLVGKNGVKNLTKTPKSIQSCIVRLK